MNENKRNIRILIAASLAFAAGVFVGKAYSEKSFLDWCYRFGEDCPYFMDEDGSTED